MPLYDFRCVSCGRIDEHIAKYGEEMVCACGAPMERLVTAAKYRSFREGWWEHLDAEPIYIRSKRQLKEECTKRGFHSEYAWD